MPRAPFNELWATTPAPDQFEQPPSTVSASGWEGGETADPPEAKWQNYWQNRVDVALQDIERRGYMTYDPAAIYGVGAYAAGSDGNIYRSQVAGNTGNNPVTDAGSNWVREPVGVATIAEARGWATNNRMLTPGRLNDSFQGANQSLVVNGRQALPGGLILQWGSISVPANATSLRSFNSPFPTAALNITVSKGSVLTVGNIGEVGASIVSASQFNVTVTNPNGDAQQVNWQAIGH